MLAAIDVRNLTADDLQSVGELHAFTFGPGRFARTAYRVRESAALFSRHCHGAWRGGQCVGSVILTAIEVGQTSGHWLLGPVAVHPTESGKGLGEKLMKCVLASVTGDTSSSATIILVGDTSFYGRFGFEAVPFERIVLPGPVDPARLLIWRGPDGKREIPEGLVQGVR